MDSKTIEKSNPVKVSNECEILSKSAIEQLRRAGVGGSEAGKNLKDMLLKIPDEYWQLIDIELGKRKKIKKVRLVINVLSLLVGWAALTFIFDCLFRIFTA